MAIDYEVEYDNRARVPEHQEIFDRWSAENTAYRSQARGAEFDLRYGSSERQTMDIFPGTGDAAAAPLAMFIHGGWWRSLAPSMFGQLAAGPNKQGVTVAVAGYDLCPQVTLPTIIEEIRAACLWLWRKYKKRIMVYGHSAGGHLAACMVATDWKMLDPSAPADLVPAAYSVSGVFELAPLLQISVNQDLKLDEKTARDCSPIYWKVPPGRAFDAVVGALESSEFLRQSKIITETWGKESMQTRYQELSGANHFTAVDPFSDGNSTMSKRVAELARNVAAMAP